MERIVDARRGNAFAVWQEIRRPFVAGAPALRLPSYRAPRTRARALPCPGSFILAAALLAIGSVASAAITTHSAGRRCSIAIRIAAWSAPPATSVVMSQRANRRLTEDERDVVRWMLREASTVGQLDELVPNVEHLRVVGQCDCGCASIDFVASALSSGCGQIAEAVGTIEDGSYVGLILWGDRQKVSALEIYSMSNPEHAALPKPASLRTHEAMFKP